MIEDIAIEGIVTAGAIVLVFGVIALLGWLVGGGVSRADARGIRVLRYSKKFRGLGVLSVVLCLILGMGGLIGLLTGEMEPRAAWVTLGVAGFFFLLSFLLLMEGFRKRVVLDEAGLTARSWFGRETHIAWEEIEKVSNRVERGSYLVCGAGKQIKLSHYLDGLDLFARECEWRLPLSIYGDAFLLPLNNRFFL
ncbi:MAG: PH domain-containing protein [Gemmataceae bacterium]|nr:PH domain-containing protein [Gemmataceae bacterium]